MERTKINRIPSGILTSDWHVREDTPVCFTGDFLNEQWTAIQFINDLQKKYDCEVYHAGDLFDHWKPSPYLLSMMISLLPDRFYTVFGQHDLPQHNLLLDYKSGINTLRQAGKVNVLTKCSWGQEPDEPSILVARESGFNPDRKILVWHHLTYIKAPFPGASGGMAAGILRKYPQYDLIVTGDNHQSFTVEYNGRILVNPGNITRQTADQMDFKPRVYLWYAEDNSVVPVYLPVTEGTISREHLELKEERNQRIEAFISQLDGNWDVQLSFEDNLKRWKEVNQVRDSVMEIIYKAIDNGTN